VDNALLCPSPVERAAASWLSMCREIFTLVTVSWPRPLLLRLLDSGIFGVV